MKCCSMAQANPCDLLYTKGSSQDFFLKEVRYIVWANNQNNQISKVEEIFSSFSTLDLNPTFPAFARAV